MLKWWVRFDDVRWKNFGREEGLLAGHLIEKWFGRRIWSRRRIVMAFSIFIALAMTGYTKFISTQNSDLTLCLGCINYPTYGFDNNGMMMLVHGKEVPMHGIICGYCVSRVLWLAGALSLFVSIFAFCISVSFTKVITSRIANLCSTGELRNISLLILMLILNYLILVFWSPIIGIIKQSIITQFHI